MNSETVFTASGATALAAAAVMLFSLSSCGGSGVEPSDAAVKYVAEVHKTEKSDLNPDSLLLYVDYSTCVAEAMNSPFFQEVQPTIVSNTPIYYSIKGNVIAREKGDTYKLLRGVEEVNNADLLTAAGQIAGQNRQAVLITDAEYWHPGVGDNLNNPYMSKAIGKWLSAGRDIYIYAEPYVESGQFDKQRYYIVFTDDRLPAEQNIHSKMARAISSLGNVKKLHLSARAPKGEISAAEFPVNDEDGLMLFNKDASRDNFSNGHPILVFDSNLAEIAQSLSGAAENKAGNPVDLPFISGLTLPKDAGGVFEIDDMDVRVYNLTTCAIDFATEETDEEGEPVKKTARLNLDLVNDVFEIGEKELESGKLALYFEKEFVESGEMSAPTLLRVDIVADEAKADFDKDGNAYRLLSWNSISRNAQGGRNNSFFESVKQAVNNDKSINPAAEGRNIIYTLYIYAE